jgi:probable addiction module antidote protein
MKKNETSILNIAEYLDNEEIVAEYLNMVSESDNPALFLRAIGHIAKSKGMSLIAEKTGLGRESLYKALNEKAHPRFETIFKVLNAMDIQMTLIPKVKSRKQRKPKVLCVAEKNMRYKV